MEKIKIMKFIIKRTTLIGTTKEVQPCKGSRLKEVNHLDCETGKLLLQKEKHWIMEIKDLQQLIKFQKKYEEIIIRSLDGIYKGIDGIIEIYYTYRE